MLQFDVPMDQQPRPESQESPSRLLQREYRHALPGDAIAPHVIGSPISLPRLVRRHSQVLTSEGGIGILSWGGELSPDSLGSLEGVIWTSAYGWHAEGPEIDAVRILMRERIAWIHSRCWA